MNSKRKRAQSPNADPPPPPATSRLRTIVRLGIFAVAITFAAVVRFIASLDNLWLDEIWSWMISVQLTSPVEIITRVHHDNNHYLNTFVMYAAGRDAAMDLYRLPAVFAGIGTVVLAGVVAKRWSDAAAVTATLITSCSFLLIQYSSEARGYAYLLFFTIASFAVLQRSLDEKSFRRRLVLELLFTSFTVMGFLSHATYAVAYFAFVSWSAWHNVSSDGWLSRRHITPLLCEVLLPACFLFILYLVDWRYLQVGGGDEGSTWHVFMQATSAALGGPIAGTAIVPVAAVVLIFAVNALYQLYIARSHLWVPMAVSIFLIPSIIIFVMQPQWPYPRYFLVSMLFLQLLSSWYLGRLFDHPRGKVAYVLILVAVLGGNTYLTSKLLKYGRGGYEAAVNHLLEHSSQPEVIVAGDHDFRIHMVLQYYFLRTGVADRLVYVETGHYPPEGPEWFVTHDFSQDFSPPEFIRIKPAHEFQLEKTFPYAGLSGFHWALYRRVRTKPTE